MDLTDHEDVLVADETSMIDVPLMHKLIQALPERAHLLIVGDVDQLPSVGPGSALADIISMAQQLVPKTKGHSEFERAQLITSSSLLTRIPPPGV